jgi:hypothetical protein
MTALKERISVQASGLTSVFLLPLWEKVAAKPPDEG